MMRGSPAPWFAASTLVHALLLIIACSTLVCDARYLRGKTVEEVPGGPTKLTNWQGVQTTAAPSKEEAQEFLRQNLEPQINTWWHHNLTPSVLEDFAKELVTSPKGKRVIAAVLAVLRNNTLTPLQYLKGQSVFWRFEALQNVIRNSGLDFPDTAFIFNLHDLGVCDKDSNCAAPVFSTYSHKDDTDLLLPVTNHEFKLQNSPWQDKLPVAFGRGGHNYNSHLYPDGMRTRVHLAMGSKEHPDKLDFGLTNFHISLERAQQLGIQKVPPVPMSDHPRWKYLVSADGVTAPNRMDKLLLMNSITLKEESPNKMFYYRSIKPWVHYVPFQMGREAVPSLLAAVEQLQANDTLAQQVSKAGQTFASKFLTIPARAWYIQRALLAYNRLFEGGVMEAWVAGQGPEKLAAELRHLLKKKKKKDKRQE